MSYKIALYGKVAMLRGECPKCGGTALICDGKSGCCNAPINGDINGVERMSECRKRKQISDEIRNIVLKKQHWKCLYCNCDLTKPVWDERGQVYRATRINFDHFKPIAFSEESSEENIVACCAICNNIKGTLIFDSLFEAQHYIAIHKEFKNEGQRSQVHRM